MWSASVMQLMEFVVTGYLPHQDQIISTFPTAQIPSHYLHKHQPLDLVMNNFVNFPVHGFPVVASTFSAYNIVKENKRNGIALKRSDETKELSHDYNEKLVQALKYNSRLPLRLKNILSFTNVCAFINPPWIFARAFVIPGFKLAYCDVE